MVPPPLFAALDIPKPNCMGFPSLQIPEASDSGREKHLSRDLSGPPNQSSKGFGTHCSSEQLLV